MPRLERRKSPVQARSAVTIEALHAATIQVLVRDGLQRCTTTRIAERAGASVGTLYQYYPNRDALIAAVLERHLSAIAAAVGRACEDSEDRPVSDMASAFTRAFVGAKLRDVHVARALYAVAQERGGAEAAARMRDRIVSAVAKMLASATDVRFDAPALTATIAVGALIGQVQTLFCGPAPSGFAERFEAELVALIAGYFCARRQDFA